jgi:hypothetical protein
VTGRADERALLAVLVLAGLALRVALAFAVPPFQAADERAHVRFVEHLVAEGALPVQPEHDLVEALRFWPQYYQPPLAYVLMTPLYALVSSTGASEAARVRALRCQNALVGALTVWVAFAVAARLTPRRDPRRLAVAALVALLPGFAASAAAVNNDALANLLAAALWLPLLRMHDSRRACWAAGLLFGAACATKLTVLPLAPLLLLVPWLARRDAPLRALRRAALAGALALLVFLPVALRNTLVYGHPLAIGAGSISFEWLAGVLPAEQVAELARPDPLRAVLEFWGQFGIYQQLRWWPVPLAGGLLALAALAGWLRPGTRALRDAFEQQLPAFAAPLVLSALALALFSLSYYGGWQGRYLYTGMLPAAALLAGGLDRLTPARLRWAGLAALTGALLALDAGLVRALVQFFEQTRALRWGLALPL